MTSLGYVFTNLRFDTLKEKKMYSNSDLIIGEPATFFEAKQSQFSSLTLRICESEFVTFKTIPFLHIAACCTEFGCILNRLRLTVVC